MDYSNINWSALSDTAWLELLGTFLRETRLQQNRTQEEVATAAGLHRSTLVQLEQGKGGTLLSMLQVLRALGQIQVLEVFQVRQQPSPLQLAKMQLSKRQRARGKQENPDQQNDTDW